MEPKTDIPNLQKVSSFLIKNRGKIIVGAIGAGLLKSTVDSDDDDTFSATGKGVKAGILAAGVSYGAPHLFKTATVQALVRGDVIKAGEEARSEQLLKVSEKLGAKMPTAVGIGMIALGAATLLDVGERMKDAHDAKAYERQQEQELKKKAKEQKAKNKQYSYGYVDSGDIVLELFGARSGHYKMGNAKFQ